MDILMTKNGHAENMLNIRNMDGNCQPVNP